MLFAAPSLYAQTTTGAIASTTIPAASTSSSVGVPNNSIVPTSSIVPTPYYLGGASANANTNTSGTSASTSGTSESTSGSVGLNVGTNSGISLGTTVVQTAPFQTASSAPAPEVVDIDTQGSALMRGTSVSGGSGTTLQLSTWGGTWIVRVNSATQVYASSGTLGDVSGIPAGHFVGIVGTIASDAPMTIDATIVRDWTTNPITTTTMSTSAPSGTGSSVSASQTSGTSGTGSSVSGTGSADTGTSVSNTGTSALSSSSTGSTASTSVSGVPAGDTLYTGQVTDMSNIASGTFTLTDPSGTQYTINVPAGATVWDSKGNVITLQSISQNDSIRIDASLQTDGTLSADVVRDTSI
jgi:hypothetical protein